MTYRLYVDLVTKPSAPLATLDGVTARFEKWLDLLGSQHPIEVLAWEGEWLAQRQVRRFWCDMEVPTERRYHVQEDLERELENISIDLERNLPVRIKECGFAPATEVALDRV